MADKLSVACVQLTSTTKIEENIAISSALIREAHAKGAQFIALPEVVNLCQRRSELALAAARPADAEPALAAVPTITETKSFVATTSGGKKTFPSSVAILTASVSCQVAACVRSPSAGKSMR